MTVDHSSKWISTQTSYIDENFVSIDIWDMIHPNTHGYSGELRYSVKAFIIQNENMRATIREIVDAQDPQVDC